MTAIMKDAQDIVRKDMQYVKHTSNTPFGSLFVRLCFQGADCAGVRILDGKCVCRPL